MRVISRSCKKYLGLLFSYIDEHDLTKEANSFPTDQPQKFHGYWPELDEDYTKMVVYKRSDVHVDFALSFMHLTTKASFSVVIFRYIKYSDQLWRLFEGILAYFH